MGMVQPLFWIWSLADGWMTALDYGNFGNVGLGGCPWYGTISYIIYTVSYRSSPFLSSTDSGCVKDYIISALK